MANYLRFRNLVDRGLFRNRQELRRLQETQGFPRGRLLGPNTRIWTDEEIDSYLATRPVEMPRHHLRGAAAAKRKAKLKRERGPAEVAAETDQLSEINEF